jgi:hypothetical protein
MKLPKKIEKEKKKKGERQSPPSIGGRALERLHQYEQERGLPETTLEQPENDADNKKEKSGDSD